MTSLAERAHGAAVFIRRTTADEPAPATETCLEANEFRPMATLDFRRLGPQQILRRPPASNDDTTASRRFIQRR
ncbi:hypothetical protein [Wenjunlia tyrosinilytica]|uniref:Uncharacterized protein n=1 Tax=Wenjunlia tyrosinilytica TaxID=1544741 RepID=A0A918E2F5_9ACTN|nr:hypothetical protein [Wenjunlia tyrosinilytica]GGO99383.1 hypothetical protein GCM10012280_65710 [Wenjunlia tyrosinilytica]